MNSEFGINFSSAKYRKIVGADSISARSFFGTDYT